MVIRDSVKRDTPYTRGEEAKPSKYDTSEAQIRARLAIAELADYTGANTVSKEKGIKTKTETDNTLKSKSKTGSAKSPAKKGNKTKDSINKADKKAKTPTAKPKKELTVLSVNTDFRYICTSEAEIHIAYDITEKGIKKASKTLDGKFIFKRAEGDGVSLIDVIKGTSGVAVYPAFSPELTCPDKKLNIAISEDGKVSVEKV